MVIREYDIEFKQPGLSALLAAYFVYGDIKTAAVKSWRLTVGK
jgi:hypothetical protein